MSYADNISVSGGNTSITDDNRVTDIHKTAGAVWTFTTASPAQAANPYPFDGQDISTSTGLRWDAGSGAGSHDIYFGTTNPPPFLRNQTGS